MPSAAYERRNERAKALGYSSYYDYRAHGNGRIPPDKPRLHGADLRRSRGHASRADLLKAARPGALVTAFPDADSRRKDGSYSRAYVSVIDGDTGREQEFLLSGNQLKGAALVRLLRDLDERGVVFSPSPSLDLRNVV